MLIINGSIALLLEIFATFDFFTDADQYDQFET